MLEKHEQRQWAISNVLKELASKIGNGCYTGGTGHFLEWDVWEDLVKRLDAGSIQSLERAIKARINAMEKP